MEDFKLLRGFFPDIDDATWKNLSADPDFLKHIPSLVKARLDSHERVTPIDDNYLLMLMSNATFAAEEEQIYIAKRLKHYFSHEGRVLPLLSDYVLEAEKARQVGKKKVLEVSEDFASRCLFSLSFFQPALERLYRKGAPHPEFYRERGKHTFRYICLECVAENFDNWQRFFADKGF
jgi:hypothetical protein